MKEDEEEEQNPLLTLEEAGAQMMDGMKSHTVSVVQQMFLLPREKEAQQILKSNL